MVVFEPQNSNYQELRKFFHQAQCMDVVSRLQQFYRLFPYAEQLPGIMWLHGANSTPIACNQLTLQCLKGELSDVIDHTIFDTARRMHFPLELAEKIEHNNRRVLNGELVIAQEVTLDGHHEHIWSSRKQPVRDTGGNVLGFLGVSILVETKHRKIIWNEPKRQYNLYPTAENCISLSVREFEVLRELLKGKTPAEIAEFAGLSPKSIESYLHRVKIKFGLTKTREVISYLIQHNLTSAMMDAR